MIQSLLKDRITIKRRTDSATVAVDVLNNPNYGAPTSGSGWTTVYSNTPARLAFSSKTMIFAGTGERVTPNGVMYVNNDITVLAEDRVITSDSIEYVVTSVVPAILQGSVVDHYECLLALP